MKRQQYEVKATVYDRKGRVLSVGFNNYDKTHPIQAQYAEQAGLPLKVYLHAEVSALVKVRNGKPYKIKVERYSKRGRPLLAKPCPICELAIKEAGISLVEYTVGDE